MEKTDFLDYAEREQLNIADVVGRSEQLKCDICDTKIKRILEDLDGKNICVDCAF